MFEFIASIIFVVSLGAVLAIVLRKIPVLVTLPQNGSTGIKKHSLILDAEQKFEEWFLAFRKMVWLHKVLSWVKVMTLKIEVWVDHLLHGIRKKAQNIDKEINEKK
jgi:hypothetical protein